MSFKTSFFLIGGAGFLGGAFSKYLTDKNCSINSILRGEIFDSQSLTLKEEALKELIISEGQNIIVDFAYTSIPNTSFSDPIKDFTENLYNTNSHLALAKLLPNSTYVYISSGGTVYGNVDNKVPIKENHENFPLSPYGITKLASEKYAFMYQQIYGINVKIVRPANIYGPGQKPFRGQGFISTAIAKMIRKEAIQIFGDGSAIRDYLYVTDFCEILFNIIEKGTSGNIYNIGSQVGYSINEVIEMIESVVVGIEPQIEYLPSRPFDVDYNVLDCGKSKEVNKDVYKVDLQSGILSSYHWLKNYLAENKGI